MFTALMFAKERKMFMTSQNLELINGIEEMESGELLSFAISDCECDNTNDNPGNGW
jgi:hypothetical protein